MSLSVSNSGIKNLNLDKLENLKDNLHLSKQTCSNFVNSFISDNLLLSDKLKNIMKKFDESLKNERYKNTK